MSDVCFICYRAAVYVFGLIRMAAGNQIQWLVSLYWLPSAH